MIGQYSVLSNDDGDTGLFALMLSLSVPTYLFAQVLRSATE